MNITELTADTHNYSFYFEDGRYDENFYVKLPNNSESTIRKAAKICANSSNGRYNSAYEMDEEDLDAFQIDPDEYDFFEPYLYDSGT